jgi:hypothetical protein
MYFDSRKTFQRNGGRLEMKLWWKESNEKVWVLTHHYSGLGRGEAYEEDHEKSRQG